MNVLRLATPIQVTATVDRFSGFDKHDEPVRKIKVGNTYKVVGVTLTGNVIVAGQPQEAWSMGDFMQNDVPAGFNRFGVRK